MIKNKHIINSLPLLAAVLGRKYGVEVVIGGDTACTNGRTIYLPTLPQDCDTTLLGLVRAYIDHESAHLRETDFALLESEALTPLEKHIWNILEDWRVEHKLAAVFPGCRVNLTWLIRHIFLDENENALKQTENADASQILDWLLFTVRSWDVSELKPKCEKLALTIDWNYPALLPQLRQIMHGVPDRCKSSRDCLEAAREIV